MIGRNRFVGNDRKNLLRMQDRSNRVLSPKPVQHVSQLPPARDNAGRIMYVGGVTKAVYFSNGTAWMAM